MARLVFFSFFFAAMRNFVKFLEVGSGAPDAAVKYAETGIPRPEKTKKKKSVGR